MKTPLAVFAYNRPRHLRQLLESLMRCERLDECQVHFFCDGVKRPEHEANVQAARQVVDEFAPQLHASVIKREQNLGLARSIVSGVSELCAQAGRVIVLEDDFILHPFFVNFMLQALERYAEDERVAQVAGFTFPILTPTKPDAFFLPVITSWGWATWSRAWDLFAWDLQSALSRLEADPALRARFDLDGAYPYTEMLRSTLQGRVDTWDIQWYWSVFSAGKLVLYPRCSLVWQNGFDEFATHTRSGNSNLQGSLKRFYQARWDAQVEFPADVCANNLAFERLKRLLRKPVPRWSAQRILGAIRRRLTRLIK